MSDGKSPADWGEEIAYELQGTCTTLEQALEAHGQEGLDNNTGFCAALDARVFLCEVCGWWHEQSEMSEHLEWTCRECEDERDEN